MAVELSEARPSILVVDDNPLILNVLKSLLLSQEYQVATAQNGKEAIDLLEKRPVDVIVCDVMMPKMDGYRLHQLVREKSDLAHIPFVFLTALDTRQEVQKGQETGADDYVTKPFDPQDLLAIVRGKVLRSQGIKHSSENRYEAYRKRVIHTLSHEFRTPLVAINTGTEMLLENLVEQHAHLDLNKVTSLLEAIQRGGARLEKLVNDFMLLQQIDAGIAKRIYDSRVTVINVESVLNQIMKCESATCEQEGFKLVLQNLCGEAQIRIYEIHVIEIMRRIFENARKFSNGVKQIEVFAYREENHLLIEVRDRGIGFEPDKIRAAVDAFGQINREKLEQQGGGLGLAIAHKYAQINSCKLKFASREGGGAIVTLVVPIYSATP